jgi:hypothetical protein
MSRSAWLSASMLAAAILRNSALLTSGKRQVPAHREVWTVDLQHEPGAMDRVVLLFHDVGEARQVGVASRIVLVLQKVRDDPR